MTKRVYLTNVSDKPLSFVPNVGSNAAAVKLMPGEAATLDPYRPADMSVTTLLKQGKLKLTSIDGKAVVDLKQELAEAGRRWLRRWT